MFGEPIDHDLTSWCPVRSCHGVQNTLCQGIKDVAGLQVYAQGPAVSERVPESRKPQSCRTLLLI